MNPLLDLAGHLIRRLNQISTHTFQKNMERSGCDLTPVQFATMQALQQKPCIEQAQVASMIAYDRATIGGVIDRLEQKGYVSRKVSPRDRRAREVSLTEKGHRTVNEIYPVVEKLQMDILDGLTKSERRQFLSLAQKIVAKGPAEEEANWP